MGRLEPGYAGDLFLAPKLDLKKTESDDPHESLLRTYPKHIHLVFIDGKPIYGDLNVMKKWSRDFDQIMVQNVPKAIVTVDTSSSETENQQRYDEIYKKLSDVLTEIAPLVEN